MLNVYARSDYGSQLQQKHVAVNRFIDIGVVCDYFDTYTGDLISPTGMFHLKLKILRIVESY